MTVEDIQERVAAIAAERHDDEAAHGDEDQLHQDVLAAIANGAENAPELAKAALETVTISFARWCA